MSEHLIASCASCVGIALLAFALGYVAPGTGWNWVGWIGVMPIAIRD